jgi:hypothetical protein
MGNNLVKDGIMCRAQVTLEAQPEFEQHRINASIWKGGAHG